MPPRSQIIGVVGARGAWKHARSYREWFHELVSRRATEIIIASAFLTEPGAQEVLAALLSLGAKKGVQVTILVGAKSRFTRKEAIRKLLAAKKAGVRVPLRVLCPKDSEFHLKALYARHGKRQHKAIVGSHNLTTLGLSAEAELGLVTVGKCAAVVRGCLLAWAEASTDWRKRISKYEEARLPEGESEGPKGSEEDADAIQQGATGAGLDASEPLTKADEIRLEKGTQRLANLGIKEGKGASWIQYLPFTVEEARTDRGYGRDCKLLYSDHYTKEHPNGWWEGQRASFLRVLELAPAGRIGAAAAVRHVRGSHFVLDADLLKQAKSLGLTSSEPDPLGASKFLRILKKRNRTMRRMTKSRKARRR